MVTYYAEVRNGSYTGAFAKIVDNANAYIWSEGKWKESQALISIIFDANYDFYEISEEEFNALVGKG